MVTSVYDPGCVKTLRGINAPEIFGSVVMRRAKKCKNLFRSALRPNQIAFSHDQDPERTSDYADIFCAVALIRHGA